jgi:hypothetical protein
MPIVPVLESGESSIHSWSGVYFFASAVGERGLVVKRFRGGGM